LGERVAQEKEGKTGCKKRNKNIVMRKLIIQKKNKQNKTKNPPGTATTKS
jgi:hypothetical protein